MKKRLLSLATLLVAMVGSAFAYNVGDYAYTATQRVKITGENLVTNGTFDSTEGWTNALGESLSAEVWDIESGKALGPNGENTITSISGSVADAALCRSWAVQPGSYMVSYDIKGETTAATGIVNGNTSCDFFLAPTDSLTARGMIKGASDVQVATVEGYKSDWKTVSYAFTVTEENLNLVMHFEKLAANTMITNVTLYPVQIVYDDRIIQSKLDYVDKLLATGKFELDTDNGFISVIYTAMKEMMGTAELDDPSNVEALMAEYEPEMLKWLDLNAGDILKDEKRWSAYGDSRKQNGFGTWTGGGGRWFHKNNGGSNEITNDGDEIGHRFQGGVEGNAYMAYPLKPTEPGTYMFSIDVVGHYMAGSSGKSKTYLTSTTDNYVTDWNRDFKGVTVYAGKDQMKDDAAANDSLNKEQEGQKVDCGVISNPNAKNNPQKFVVFYEVSQAMIDAGESVWFGMTYVMDPEKPTTKLGTNVNIANPQIRLVGVTQELIDYKNEVAKIIAQQGPLKERLQWANEDIQKTAQDGYPWGKDSLKKVVEAYQPVYDASLEIIGADSIVKNADFIKQCMADATAGTGILYSDSLLHSVQALNSGRSAYSRFNQPIADYRQKIADAEAVRDDAMNSLGDKKTFQAAIDAASAKLNELLPTTTDETRDTTIAKMNEALGVLAEAVEAFKKSAALDPIVDIDFANNFEPWLDAEGVSLGMLIKGNKGQMTFPEGVADSTDNTGAPDEKGRGAILFVKGIGEELLDVLRVGNGSATVQVADADLPTDDEVIRFNFNAWLLRLTDGFFTIDLLNAADQRVAGFSYCVYDERVNYNDFNNEANEGMILNKQTAVGNTAGDAASHADNNKSAFSLIVDYKAKAVQGIVEGPNGITTGALIPMRTMVDESTPLDDNKVAKFVLSSSYKNYVGRRCWFDDLKAYKYPSQADGPIVDGIQTVKTVVNDNAIYSISGVRVTNALKPGLYIKNGKKFLVK